MDSACDREQGTYDHQQIRMVSLGCYCGPKLSLRKVAREGVGHDAETLPFDWVRTRLDGVLHYMRSDFSGFFDFDTKEPVGKLVMHRSYLKSFWHDNPLLEEDQEKYKRRFARFNEIDARSLPVLFVRSVATTDELPRIAELLEELQTRFGDKAMLLVLVDFQQKEPLGPVLVEGHPGIMVNFLTSDIHTPDNDASPYCGAIRVALDWATGKPLQLRVLSMTSVIHGANFTDWGLWGLGGFRAFEEHPSTSQETLEANPATLKCPEATPALQTTEATGAAVQTTQANRAPLLTGTETRTVLQPSPPNRPLVQVMAETKPSSKQLETTPSMQKPPQTTPWPKQRTPMVATASNSMGISTASVSPVRGVAGREERRQSCGAPWPAMTTAQGQRPITTVVRQQAPLRRALPPRL